MRLDGKVKGGLAWAGLVVILAVPAADVLFGQSDATTTAAALTTEPTTAKPVLKFPAPNATATADPVETASTAGGDAVDKYVKSGKKLPSYISDGEAVAATTTKPAATVKPVTATPVSAPTEVASALAEAPPVPLPRDARPKATQVASLPSQDEQPLILDEAKVQQQEQAAAVEPFPLSDDGNGEIVTGDELEEWDSGSLADYLERKGLLSGSTQQASDSDYDPDGFYLDQGPNKPRKKKQDLEFFLF